MTVTKEDTNLNLLITLTPDQLAVHAESIPTVWLEVYMTYHIEQALQERMETIEPLITLLVREILERTQRLEPIKRPLLTLQGELEKIELVGLTQYIESRAESLYCGGSKEELLQLAGYMAEGADIGPDAPVGTCNEDGR